MSLKEFFFKISFLYSFLPVRFLMKIAEKKKIAVFYHLITEDENELTNHLYKAKNKTAFIKDIQYLKKYFSSTTVDDFSKKIDEYRFLLSFDDGLSNFYHVVAPILEKEKVQAISFLNSTFIDNKDLFYRYKVNLLIEILLKSQLDEKQKKLFCNIIEIKKFHLKKLISKLKKLDIHQTNTINSLLKIVGFSYKEYLDKNKPYLSGNQILKLEKKGFQFGAHSKCHPRYSKITLADQIEQTVGSLDSIKSSFDIKSNYFAFPFSDDADALASFFAIAAF